MEDRTINVFLTSFPGLGLPPTLSLPIKASTSVAELTAAIRRRIPTVQSRLLLTTSRNKLLEPSSQVPLFSLLPEDDTILPLRLSVPLCGGKGGFGSQLRAAGGRMSSRKKKKTGDQNGSSRNLDGRRLRTINEAKALAEYLAVKPEMDRKQKELRRQRWEQVVEAAERREEEIRNGSKGRVDGQWVEDKEEAGERTREAVKAAMASGQYKDLTLGEMHASSSSQDAESSESSEETEDSVSVPTSPEDVDHNDKGKGKGKEKEKEKGKAKEAPRAFFGWDEDDEFMSDDDDSDRKEDEEEDEIADK